MDGTDKPRNDERAAGKGEGALLDWLAGPCAAAQARHPDRLERFETPSGIVLAPLYDGAQDGGFPGEYPFTRGVRTTMYRGRLWTMRQYAGFASARETNRRFKMLLAGGQTGLSTAFDLPTQIGYDSDHPLAVHEVGKVGVPVNSLADMEHLFADIPLDEVSTSMTINATAGFLLCAYVALAMARSIEPSKLRGTVQNDILKEYAARGNYRFPVGPSLRLTTDLMAFCKQHVPRWNTISVSGYHIREAGSTAVQELAFTLANGRAYLGAALAAGLDIDEVAPRLSFFFNAHNHLFEEVGKFRAARRMWARIVREEFKAKNPESWMLRFHTQTAGSMLTSQQADNNVVRVTIQALAAVLGGTQSLHTNARDEALGLPTEESARLALRTQQILAEESGVADVIDPLGGAPYVEWLTDELERRALALMAAVEEKGGAVAAIEAGFVQREIHRSALQWQREVEKGERPVVGVNRYEVEEGEPEVFRPDAAAREDVLYDLERVRAERDGAKVEGALAALAECARGTGNLLMPMLTAVSAYATVGEVCTTLEEVFGTYKPPEVLVMKPPESLAGVVLGLHHVAIVVKSVDESRALYEDVLGMRAGEPELVPDQRVRVLVLRAGGQRIELVEPAGDDSPVTRFLERGGGIHHLAWHVASTAGAIAHLLSRGVRMIDTEPRPGSHGTLIAFVHPKATGGVLMELVEDPQQREP